MRTRRIVSFGVGALVASAAVLYIATANADARSGGQDGPPIAGCVEVRSGELYVQYAYECPDGTRVLKFADDTARDAYLKVAEGFGSATVSTGPGWARIR